MRASSLGTQAGLRNIRFAGAAPQAMSKSTKTNSEELSRLLPAVAKRGLGVMFAMIVHLAAFAVPGVVTAQSPPAMTMAPPDDAEEAISEFARLDRQLEDPSIAGFDPARLEIMNQRLRRFVDEKQHVGFVWTVAREGFRVSGGVYGVQDPVTGDAMTEETIFSIYSMSKIVTSVAVLCLVEDGLIRLDEPVSVHLPPLGNMQVMAGGTAAAPTLVPVDRPVTIKHLLTHTAGIPYEGDGDELTRLYKAADLWNSSDLGEFVARLGTLPLKHQPGTQFTYGLNTDVLGALVEKVSGQPFEAFLAERIFKKLEMVDTFFQVPAEKRSRLARISKHGDGGEFVIAEPLLGVGPDRVKGINSGGGGLFSTVSDYLRFAQMLANRGSLGGQRILGPKTVELMTSNHLVGMTHPYHGFNPSQGFGLGVEIQTELGRGTLPGSPGSFGWYGAATTYVRIDPQEGMVSLLLVQHFPYNEHKIFEVFQTMLYASLTE